MVGFNSFIQTLLSVVILHILCSYFVSWHQVYCPDCHWYFLRLQGCISFKPPIVSTQVDSLGGCVHLLFKTLNLNFPRWKLTILVLAKVHRRRIISILQLSFFFWVNYKFRSYIASLPFTTFLLSPCKQLIGVVSYRPPWPTAKPLGTFLSKRCRYCRCRCRHRVKQ